MICYCLLHVVKCSFIIFIQIIASVNGCHTNPKLYLPITIGTYPIIDEPSLPESVDVQSKLALTNSADIQHQSGIPSDQTSGESFLNHGELIFIKNYTSTCFATYLF